MAIASPPKPPGKRKRKATALPAGVEQPSIFNLDSLEKKEAAPARKKAKRARKTKVSTSLPEGVKQLTLEDLLVKYTYHEEQPEQSDTTRRAKKGADHERVRQPTQLGFDVLAESQSGAADGTSARESVRGGPGSGGGETQRSAVRTGSDTEDEPPGGLGDSSRSDSPARPGRRVILDDPEPEPRASRDLRITPEHGIGSGSLKEKAEANIAAIKLLKKLEEEDREATEEEKAVLVRYAGWGALYQCFETWRLHENVQRTSHEWQTVKAGELKQLLTDEEYTAAKATTPNAHFTSPAVVSAIWEGLEKLGVNRNPEVLEPSMGVGHFFGLMPEALRSGHRTGVELDSITARIAKKLYPDSTVFHKGFEETPLPDNYFDVVVGNVPFGDYGVHDPSMKPKLRSSIHDYFFAKSLEKLRPGGMMALVTSHYTMDKKDDTIRKHLAQRADLVAAVRLPNTTFKGNAGTEVVTDILFLRKREEGAEPAGEQWTEASATRIDGHEITLNEYYVRHPEMMLGEMKLIRGMYRDKEPTLAGELTPGKLQEALKALPEGVYLPRDLGRSPPPSPLMAPPEAFIGVKDGAYAEVDGNIMRRTGGTFESVSLSAGTAQRIQGMIHIRDAVREVFRTQLDDEPDSQIVAARNELNRVYDEFVRTHGYLSTKENFRAFAGDPDHPLLLSLENYNADTKTAAKTAVFQRRTLERYKPVDHVETAAEALAISLNETGGIDWNRMAQLTGSRLKEMQTELAGLVYQDPAVGGKWQTADEYLSGDVRQKLRTAQAAADINPIYRSNVEALKAVQPADILPGDINARLGASWIPSSDIKAFIGDLLKVREGAVTVGHGGPIATWSVELDIFSGKSVANTTTYGTGRRSASTLIEDALNMRTPTVYDKMPDGSSVIDQAATIAAREAQQKIKDRFAKWVWEDPDRAVRLARIYNDRFNNIRLRTYDGSHLTLPGMNRIGLRNNDLDPHQKNAVWRALQNKNTLIGHVVGAGKTASITAAAMELKRLGLASKSMIVVPNHLVEQWGSEFLKLYPQANIFVAGKDLFTAGNREKAMARIATGNYDAVIISHKSFESLPVSDETFKRFVNRQIDSLEDAIAEAKEEKGDNRSVVKDLEKAKKRLEARIKDRAGQHRKDGGVTWEQLGIDRIFVDEADLFKNLGYTTKMNRIAGLPNTESNRALDMYMKTQYLNERGGGTVFATGTPISNTMAEMYTLMRYLAPQVLEAAGVEHFDAWAANFGEAVTALELAPDGSGYRMHTRFSKFVNMPELLSMFRSFADIQTAEMLNLPRPAIEGGKPQVVAAPASPELKEYVAHLVRRARLVRNGSVEPHIDNMLKITGDGRKAALDMRLVDPEAEPNPDSKLNRAIENVYRIWKETAATHSTQLVFCDLSTPNPDKFNVYDEMKRTLVARGIPEKEIAYIHDADTDAKKKLLFDAVNAGRIRVLLGSTEKMGAGTNVQKKLIAVHHLDAPWRPRDIEQRDGRILRQGNENKQVQVYRYVTEGSFDAYMWQTLQTKYEFICQVMRGDITVREMQDLESGALSYAEIKAIASGNPAVMEKVKLDTEIRKLDILRAAHINQQYEISDQIRGAPGKIENARSYHARLCEDIATRDAGGEKFSMTVEGRKFTGKNAREEAATALIEAVMAAKGDPSLVVRGQYKGLDILSSGNQLGEEYLPGLYLRGKNTYTIGLNPDSALGTLASMEHVLRRLDRLAEEEQSKCERMEKALADYREQLGRPFEHEERLRELLIKQQEINKRLDLDKGDIQAVDEFMPPASAFDREREERWAGGRPAHEATGLVEPGKREAGGTGQTEQKMDTQADLASMREYMQRRQKPGSQREQNEDTPHVPATFPQETGQLPLQVPEAAATRQPENQGEIQQKKELASAPQPAYRTDTSQQQSRSKDDSLEGQGLAPETVRLFSTRKAVDGLLTCQIGGKGPPSRIVITENIADAMSYYQLCGCKPGLYIALTGEASGHQKSTLRQIVSNNSQAIVVTATHADRDGEKHAVFISSICPDAVRARPGRRERRDIKYESWQDVLMNRPMQPVVTSPPRRQPEHSLSPESAHEVTPSVTPMNWGGRGRSAIPPSDQTG